MSGGVFLGGQSAKLYLGDIPIATGEATLTTKTITSNGTYPASSDNADGYSSVTVAVVPTSPYVTGILYDLDNFFDRIDFRNDLPLSNGLTIESCFLMGSNEASVARFINGLEYDSSDGPIILSFDTYNSVRRAELNFYEWVLEADDSNSFDIPIGELATLSAVLTTTSWALYLNGTLMTSGLKNNEGRTVDGFCFGKGYGRVDRTLLHTTIYSTRAYNRALTAAEIAANRAADVDRFSNV